VTAPSTAAPPTVTEILKVPVVVIVDAFIRVLKVTAMFWLSGTVVAPLAGTVAVTAGGGSVVNVDTKLAASGTPAGSFAPVVMVAVNNVLLARTAAGVNVAVFPAKLTDPVTAVAPGPVSVNVVVLIVVASIGTLNVAEMVVLTATVVALFAGTVETTVGGAAVVNVHTKLAASGTPAGSFAPVVMVAVNIVLLARIPVGVKVAVEPA
jgi:hypothetical protein